MATPDDRVLQYLISVETLAEEVLVGQRRLVELDKAAQGHRLALRELAGRRRVWLGAASSLVRCSAPGAAAFIRRQEEHVQRRVEETRNELKNKVNRLRDLEMKPPVPGLGLSPLSLDERGLLIPK